MKKLLIILLILPMFLFGQDLGTFNLCNGVKITTKFDFNKSTLTLKSNVNFMDEVNLLNVDGVKYLLQKQPYIQKLQIDPNFVPSIFTENILDTISMFWCKEFFERTPTGHSGTIAGTSDWYPSLYTGITTLAFRPEITNTIFQISGNNQKALIKFSFKNDSIQAIYTNIDSAAEAVVKEVSKILQGRLDEKQRIIDSLTNKRCVPENKSGFSMGSSVEWKDRDLFYIGLRGDLRVYVLGQEICDPDGVLNDYLDFCNRFRNMEFLTLNPKTGEQGYAQYGEIKGMGLLVKHYEYTECCYPFHRDSWIPASEIDKYDGYFWPNGGPYVLIGYGK